MHIKTLLFALFSILLFADYASACSCLAARPPCEAFKTTPAIFVAVVNDIEPPDSERFSYAQLTVEEAFKGISQSTIRMPQGTGSGDCSFVLEKGERYLFYAKYSEELKAFMTSICTRSRPLAYAGEDLAYLRGLPATDSVTSLSGTVIKYDYHEEHSPSVPELIKGVKITAEAKTGERFEAVTGDDGVYKIAGLPPGNYKMRAAIPSYLKLVERNPDTVEVPVKGCASLVFLTTTDGRIGGVVRDAGGKIAPEVKVDLIPFEMANRLGDRGVGDYEKTDLNGTFEFGDLKPGRYLLGVNIRSEPEGDSPFPRTFFPGVANVSEATVITLGKGEKLKGYELRLPPPLPVITISGVVVWPDGKPVVKGMVVLNDSANTTGGRDLAFAGIDKQGRFSLKALQGTEAWVHAHTTIVTASGLDMMTAEPVRVIAGPELRPLKLVILKKGPGGVRIIK